VREIVTLLGLPEKPIEIEVPKDLVSWPPWLADALFEHPFQHITTMSRYNAEFPFPIAFPPQPMTNVLSEWLGKQGVKQAHIAGNGPFYARSIYICNWLQKRKSMHTSPSSSTAVSKSSLRGKSGT
jgi:2,3-bisphosphoglycerate-independent phosphoglycerate mutase